MSQITYGGMPGMVTLTKLIDTPDVFSVQSLSTKKRNKPAMEGTTK
ncbi:hypothetical protein JZU46_06215 [bacterium]|jgi:hypothetical protein|nr:hypothetical protein [bacterium]